MGKKKKQRESLVGRSVSYGDYRAIITKERKGGRACILDERGSVNDVSVKDLTLNRGNVDITSLFGEIKLEA